MTEDAKTQEVAQTDETTQAVTVVKT